MIDQVFFFLVVHVVYSMSPCGPIFLSTVDEVEIQLNRKSNSIQLILLYLGHIDMAKNQLVWSRPEVGLEI